MFFKRKWQKMSGFIKIYRTITEWEWADDPNVMVLWVHLLTRANYKPNKYRGHTIPAGGLVYGHGAFAKHTGLTIKQIRTAMKKLENSKNVAVNRAGFFSVVTISDWCLYQSVKEERAGNRAVKGQSRGSQGAVLKELKKGRSKEDNPLPPFIQNDVWEDFKKHRGSNFTKLAQSKIINQLTEWHAEGYNANDILNMSIMNGWKGVFKPKHERKIKNDPKDELQEFLGRQRD